MTLNKDEFILELSRKLKSDFKMQLADAAVALLLRFEDRTLKALVVKRVTNISDPWSGDMALPGGKRTQEDQSLLQTVVRETDEETGINLLGSYSRLLGTLCVFTSTRRPDLEVLPFVGVLEKPPLITLNNELESYVWIDVNDLAQSQGEAEIEGRKVPAFVVRQHVIWGLTFRILDSFAHRFLKAA